MKNYTEHAIKNIGLVSIERIPQEWRIHIRLLTVSKENKGNEKIYDEIAGNLIAFVAKIAIREFGELACVSLLQYAEGLRMRNQQFGLKVLESNWQKFVRKCKEITKKTDCPFTFGTFASSAPQTNTTAYKRAKFYPTHS